MKNNSVTKEIKKNIKYELPFMKETLIQFNKLISDGEKIVKKYKSL